ncbi:MAG: T9SS type A sorting domain-containing protein [bacterium]
MVHLMIFSLLFGYVYEDADSLIVQNDSLVICGNHQYNIKVHISQAGKLEIRQWSAAADSTGWLLLNAPLILIQDSSSINGSKTGYMGGNNTHPDGYGPGYGEAGGISGGAGGGAGYGGNGGNGSGIPGMGGNPYGNNSDTLIEMGSGGGAGRLSAVEGFGGNGGAKISLRGQKINIDSSYIETNGENGDSAAIVAGGGGSGGGIMIWADSTVIHNSEINASGGEGGHADIYGGYGGGGAGGGRIKIYYTTSLDTSDIVLSVQGGAEGTGGWGNGEPGTPGSIHIEQILGIQEHICSTVKRFSLQSNILKTHAFVNIPKPPLQLNLYDVTGRMIRVFKLTKNTNQLYLGDQAQGVYFLQSDSGDYTVEKIILLK